MNPVLLDLGIIKIYWYSIMILLGVFIGGSLIIKEAKRFKIPEDYIINLILYTIIFGVIGARLYYVVFEWQYLLLKKNSLKHLTLTSVVFEYAFYFCSFF